jgi:hypothetical protein
MKLKVIVHELKRVASGRKCLEFLGAPRKAIPSMNF